MSGRDPNRVRQAVSVMTADGSFVATSVSASVNSLPWSAEAPSRRNVLAVTNVPKMRSGVSPPVRLTLCPRTTPSSWNARVCSRQSLKSR
jgi:hypothetical protein